MTDFKAKKINALNSILAGAPLQTPLGELTALPSPASWIWGPHRGRGRGWAGEEEGKGGEGKGRGSGGEGKGGPPSYC